MKKTIAMLLTAMLLSLASVSTFAASETITQKGRSGSADVKGTYVAGGTAATVYSVDIAWGSMEFTYQDASEGTWNPKTHQYDNTVAAEWSCEEGANKVSVTNHSNTAVTAQLDYAPEQDNEITGTFSEAKLNLGSAVDTDPSNAPKDSATLELKGALSADKITSTKIGTVTVTLVNE